MERYTTRKISDEASVFYRTTLRLAIPVMLQSLLSGSFSMLDTLMVSSLGDTALSAIAMAAQWTSIQTALTSGICAALSVFASQKFGVNDRRGIRASGGIALFLVGLCVLVMTLAAEIFPTQILGFYTSSPEITALGVRYLRIVAFAYPLTALEACLCAMLRSTEQVTLPLAASFTSMLLNVCGNYVLIYGKLGLPALGVEGAALATVLSAAASPAVILLFSRRKKTILTAPIAEYFGFCRKDVAEFLRRCLPLIANLFFYALGQTVVTSFFTRSGEYHAAVMSIVGSVNGILSAAYSGLSVSTHVIIGQQIGNGEIRTARKNAVRYIGIAAAISVLLGGALVLLHKPILSLFNLNGTLRTETLAAAAALLVFLGLDRIIVYPCGIIMDGIFRAGGDTPASALIDILFIWCVSVPVTALDVQLLKLPFVTAYILTVLAEFLPKTAVTVWYFHTDRWMKPVTEVGKDAVAAYHAGR